jgi:hypothetical protein
VTYCSGILAKHIVPLNLNAPGLGSGVRSRGVGRAFVRSGKCFAMPPTGTGLMSVDSVNKNR